MGKPCTQACSRMLLDEADLTETPQDPAIKTLLPAPGNPPPGNPPPTHFHPFRSLHDCILITQTSYYLRNSGFYWGPLDADEANSWLADQPLGTFLLRDSTQTDVFFTLSYRDREGPTNVRVLFGEKGFSLAGSKHVFPCIFALLEHYISSPKKCLRRPYRRATPQGLQELARAAVIQRYGRQSIAQLPVGANIREFLNSYPFCI